MDASPDQAEMAAVDAAWQTRWPDSRPIGHELRSSATTSWVRFHSLPQSKRYAESDSEYDELLRRQFTLLSELCQLAHTSPDDLRVVTVSWSDSPEPEEREPHLVAAFPAASSWRSLPYDPSVPTWTHLYLSRTAVAAAELRALLLLVADDRTSDVIIGPPGCEWLLHPYDGGTDVIAPDSPSRDLLRSRHTEWLSSHPKGL